MSEHSVRGVQIAKRSLQAAFVESRDAHAQLLDAQARNQAIAMLPLLEALSERERALVDKNARPRLTFEQLKRAVPAGIEGTLYSSTATR